MADVLNRNGYRGGGANQHLAGIHPNVELSRKAYEKGISLSKEAMKAVEARLQRHPELPEWDILIRPGCMV